MDRSWISEPKSSKAYRKGVEEFINFASQNALAGGKMDCPCIRCRNHESLKRGMIRKHLLKYGFDSDYMRWDRHGEVNQTSGCSESTEKNEGAVDEGSASKSTKEDSGGLPKHAKEEVKDIKVEDQGPDQKEDLILKVCYEPEGKIKLVATRPYKELNDQEVLLFAHSLLKLRRKFGWDREPLNELINYVVKVFPLFHRLPKCFNSVWNVFSFENINSSSIENLNLSDIECGNSKALELTNKVLENRHSMCYACGQVRS